MGHHINNMLWGYNRKGLNEGPLAQYKVELESIASQPRPGQSAVPEGFAEFMRHYLTDPAKVKAATPNFYDYFENQLGSQQPAMFAAIKDVQRGRQVDEPRMGEANQRVDRHGQPAGRLRKALDTVKDAMSSFDGFYTAAVDSLRPIEAAVEQMKARGGPAMNDQDAYTLARLLAGWWGKADHFLYRGTFNPNTLAIPGKSLQEILRPIEKYLAPDKIGTDGPFRRYLIAKRTVEAQAIQRDRHRIR
jgi:hypothetical protein